MPKRVSSPLAGAVTIAAALFWRASCAPPAKAYNTYCPPPALDRCIVSPAVYVPPSDFPATIRALPALGAIPMMAAHVAVAQACSRLSLI